MKVSTKFDYDSRSRRYSNVKDAQPRGNASQSGSLGTKQVQFAAGSVAATQATNELKSVRSLKKMAHQHQISSDLVGENQRHLDMLQKQLADFRKEAEAQSRKED